MRATKVCKTTMQLHVKRFTLGRCYALDYIMQ
nr:MAG TPA: hypothetical protein [Caudoviricetes sp.]